MSSKITDIVKSTNSLKATIHLDTIANLKYVFEFGYTTAEQEKSIFDGVSLELFIVFKENRELASLIRCRKTRKNNAIFTLTVSSIILRSKEQELIVEDDINNWQIVRENWDIKMFDISVHISVRSQSNLLYLMYADSEFTDFVIKTKDGSVPFHRSVLATTSPVFRNMLKGSWKEAKESTLDLTDTSKSTLQHFKDYIYKQKLPNNDESLQQLLLLAKFCMVDCLEQACLLKLIDLSNAANAYELVNFSVVNDMPELMIGIFNKIQAGFIKVVDVELLIKKRKSKKDEEEVVEKEEKEVVVIEKKVEG